MKNTKKGMPAWAIVLIVIGVIFAVVIFSGISFDTQGVSPSVPNDNITNNLDYTPSSVRYINKYYEWNYAFATYKFNLNIPSENYDYYSKLPRRDVMNQAYVTPDDPTIQLIAENLKKTIEENNYNLVDFTLSFIKNMHYVRDANTGYDEYPKYPVQTLVEETGDCEDTSYLTASIIRAMGYGVVLLVLPEHMAIGVWCDECEGAYVEFEGKKYSYLETTGEGWELGVVPEQFENKNVTIIPIL